MSWRVVGVISLLLILGACSSSGDNTVGEPKDTSTTSDSSNSEVTEDSQITDTVIASPDFSPTATSTVTTNQDVQPTSNVPVDDSTPLPPTLANQVEDCNRRYDLPLYSVQAGQNLTVIAQNFGITLDELIEWNCIANPNRLLRGDLLHVPRQAINDDPLCSDSGGAVGDDVVAILPRANFDGHCYRLTILTTVTISWYTNMTDLTEVTFYIVNEALEVAEILGIDDTPDDGFSVTWRIPQDLIESRIYATGIGTNGNSVGSDPVIVYIPQAQ